MQRPAAKARFVRRLDGVRAAVLRMRMVQGIGWGLFIASCALGASAATDYVWELPWDVRAGVLAAATGLALAIAAVGVVRSLVWWSRPRTAREIEARFPQLGQRVRTIVQFSGRDPRAVSREGVKPTLVAALEEETEREAQPLDLRAIVPRRQAIMAIALAATPVVLIVAGLLVDWQWRLAVARALLSDRPYTTVAVEPGDALIDQGRGLVLSLTLGGRVDRPVSLLTRKAHDPAADWEQQELGAGEVRQRSPDGRCVQYAVVLDKVAAPFDYRFVAGPIRSAMHHIAIRYPLGLTKFEATLTPPRYTGLRPKTVEGGDLEVIEGSEVRFCLEFDRAWREAYLLVRDPPYKARDARRPPPVRIPLEPGPDGLVAALRLGDDKLYSVMATAREGGPLPENQYRIRVRKDQPPRVHFEDPPEAWEVNPIAEVPMRIRVADDFGVSQAGIVFQIDNGEEHRLVTKAFRVRVEADDGATDMESEKRATGLTTHAMIEALLCLEDFPVTETSAVTYYAYVEDNYPGKPKRAETDLRFIEIRPFQRFYKVGGT